MPLCGAGAAARLWLLCGRAGVAALGVCARDCAVYDSSCRAVPKHIFAGRFAGWHQWRDVEGGQLGHPPGRPWSPQLAGPCLHAAVAALVWAGSLFPETLLLAGPGFYGCSELHFLYGQCTAPSAAPIHKHSSVKFLDLVDRLPAVAVASVLLSSADFGIPGALCNGGCAAPL
jgi:hypothetical protein